MKVSVTTLSLHDLDVDLLMLPVGQGQAGLIADELGGTIGDAITRAAVDFDGKRFDTLICYPESGRARRIALIGLGDTGLVDRDVLRQLAAAGVDLSRRTKASTVALCLPETDVDWEGTGQALVEGFILNSYEFNRYKTSESGTQRVERLVLHVEGDEKAARRGAERGRVEAEATCTARDLVNASPSDKTPTMLARAVERFGRKYGYEVSIWDKSDIEKEKMGGLLAVNRGSTEPPVLIEMTWRPTNCANPNHPVVLVGKGVVFDTGGLSLKPTKNSMDHMKADMAGAAAVIGAMEAVARLSVPAYVIGLIPATDNRPGVDAYVPGDVVHMHSGLTVEVLNTDAEGRMILADALSYAKLYRPEVVIDVATLTGAQVVALGSQVAAVMTPDDFEAEDRLEAIENASRASGDRVHPMPMHDHYGDALNSKVADIKNIGNREAGSITAAKFLEHFTDYPWIHLDIAGPAFLKKPLPYRPVGGTGFGVRLLTELLRNFAHPNKR